MSTARQQNIPALLAIILATAGICLTAYTISRQSETDRIHQSRKETLRNLDTLRATATGHQGAQRLLQTITNAPADLQTAAQKISPALKLQTEPPKDQPLPGGWTQRSITATLEKTSPIETGRLIEYLENQQPPWRLAAFDYTATAEDRGNATLLLQTILRPR